MAGTPIREIIIDWNALNVKPGVTVLHYEEGAATAANQRASIGTFLTAIKGVLASGTTATVRTSGKVIDSETGVLTGFWSEATAQTATGTGGSDPVANAAQGLLRLRTGVIVRGRLLQGRVFVPGLAQAATVGGQLTTSAQTTINTAGATWAGATITPVVWSRPIKVSVSHPVFTPGQMSKVTSVTSWNELAVWRKRRG